MKGSSLGRRTPWVKPERRMPPVPAVRPTPRATMNWQPNGAAAPPAAAPAPKQKPSRRSQAIRDSANGENCTVRILGCPGRADMTIWSHYRGEAGGKGMGIKSIDRAGAYACTYCDAVYDGQRPRPAGWTKADVDLAWHQGHIRSLVLLEAKGLL